MLQAFFNMWRLPELRNKLLFTISMLAIYRIGFFIPLPAVDQAALLQWAEGAQESAAGRLIDFVGIFTGGSLSQSTIFGLGIMPYISAAIIFQLLASVYEPLKKLQKEGPRGRQKIQEYTRYATVALCLVQAFFYLGFLQSQELIYAQFEGAVLTFWLSGLVALTGGTVFMMWLGEQIDKYGIGNGISLIITAGILAGMPNAVQMIIDGFGSGQYGPDTVLFLVLAFVVVVGGSIIITQGQRRIPIQHGKHTRGRRVYGGQKSYLPLRVNHGGVMPIIFASSLMIFPTILLGWLSASTDGVAYVGWFFQFLDRNFHNMASFLYNALFIGLIYFFAYFWTSIQFQPKEMADQLREHGSFIPGLRPGPRTADYLESVMERITYVGAGFLAVIAVIPGVVSGLFDIPFQISSYLGGTGLLIVVSVMLDFIQRVEAALLMRNYQGFLGEGGSGKGPRIRGPRSGP